MDSGSISPQTQAMGKKRTKADWTNLEGLFSGYLQGDPQETHLLFTELLRVLQGYFGVRLGFGADAEDLAQAALLKIHFARDRFDPKQSLKTWVFTIASRSLIDHWRSARPESSLNETGSLADSSSEDISTSALDGLVSELIDPARKTELHRDLNHGLMQLKPMERSIVYLYGVEGLSMAEIGQALSITEGAAKLRAHRAYQELRRILGVLVLVMPHLWKDLKWM